MRQSTKYIIILRSQALIVEEPSIEPKESNPANLVSLKTQASAVRDQIHRTEKDEFKGRRTQSLNASHNGSSHNSNGNISGGGVSYSKASEKHRKKLAEIEAQLVLASPTLLFQVNCLLVLHNEARPADYYYVDLPTRPDAL